MVKQIDDKKECPINDRTLAFILNDALNLSICELCRYIEKNYKSIDCNIIKKNYTYVSANGCDIKEVLTEYVLSVLKDKSDLANNENIRNVISGNIDVFFDIEFSNNDTIIIELSS